MRIRSKATWSMFGVIAVISVFSGYINYKSNVKLIHSGMRQDLRTVSSTIQVDIDNKASQAASLASLVVNDSAVLAALRAGDREKLIQLTVPPFLIQKEKFGVVDGHFHVLPAISFLRVYKTDSFGDDLSKVRELILATQKQERPLQGIEISATGVSIKGVDVVKDGNKMIGTFEVGISFQSVLENLKKVTGFESAAFINNAKMNLIATKAVVPDPERIIGGYRNVFATNWNAIRSVTTPALMTTVNDITYKVQTVDGQFDGLVIIPLLDFKGEQIGSIWALGDFSQYQKELRVNLVLSVSFAIFQAILLSALVFVVFSSYFFLPINDVIEKVDQLSEGNGGASEKLGIWTDRKDELGSLARSIQKLANKIYPSKPEKK